MQVVYADVLFIINFSMDFLIMYGVGRLLHRKIKLFLLVLSAVLGGIYAVISLLLPRGLTQIICTFAMSFLLCIIAYPKKQLKIYLKTVFLFFAGSVLLGGGVTVCYTFIDSLMPSIYTGAQMPSVSPSFFFLICGVCVILCFITGKIFTQSQKAQKINVKIKNGNTECSLLLLSDTGNLLTEPLSGLPVIILGRDRAKNAVPSDILPMIYSGDVSKSKNLDDVKKVRFIPSSTTSGNAVLLGFIPEQVSILHNKTEYRVECVLALCEKDSFSDCDGILPACLLK